MRLPLLAILGIALAATTPLAHAEPRIVSVAIDVRAIGDADFRRLELLALQRKLALRLAQTGFALVGLDREPAITLELRIAGDGLEVVARTRVGAPGRRIPRGAGTLEAYHLEVLHKAVEAAREAEVGLPPAPDAAPTTQRSSPTTQAATPTSRPVAPALRPAATPRRPAAPARPRSRVNPPTPRPRPWFFELSGTGIAIYRVQGLDPMLRLGLRYGGTGLGLRASLGLCPSIDSDLLVVEWSLEWGASYRLDLGRALLLEAGLIGGILHHIYRIEGADPSAGSRLDFVASLPLELGWQALPQLGLRLWVAPGIAEESRAHLLDGQTVWERSLFRLEGGATLVWVLR